MRWTFGPVVPPADDHVAAFRRMTVVTEVATLVLELDAHPLPLTSFNLQLCLAVGESCLNGLHEIPELARNHAEQEDAPVLVDRFVSQATEVDWIAVSGSILKFRVAVSSRSRVGRRGCPWRQGHRSWCDGAFERKKRHDVCPFRTTCRELTELGWDPGPWTELPLEDPRAVASITPILVAGRNLSSRSEEHTSELQSR